RPADAGAPPADARPTQTVATAATHGTIEVPFGVTVHGSSAAVRVSLDGNVGTVAVGSRPAAPALAYGFSQFPGYHVYQVLAAPLGRRFRLLPGLALHLRLLRGLARGRAERPAGDRDLQRAGRGERRGRLSRLLPVARRGDAAVLDRRAADFARGRRPGHDAA